MKKQGYDPQMERDTIYDHLHLEKDNETVFLQLKLQGSKERCLKHSKF